MNNKTFVGRLTRMAGKRDVMTCGLLLCDVTAISRQRHARQLLLHVCEIAAERLFEHVLCISSLKEKSTKIKTCISNHSTVKKSVQIENNRERSIATSSSSAILDCSPLTRLHARYGFRRPIRISTPNTVIFMASCDHDLSNKLPTF